MEHVTPPHPPTTLDHTPTTSQTRTPNAEQKTAYSPPGSKQTGSNEPPPRTHLSTPKHNFELLASRTVSQAIFEEACASRFPTSPLDSINPSLYPRFPRFSTTTESSQPDLSTDEVTSTRISLDEEGILTTRRSSNTSNTRSSKRKKFQTTLHRAVSTPTLGWKRIGDRFTRAPRLLLHKKPSNHVPRTNEESQKKVVQVAETSNAPCHSLSSSVDQAVLKTIDSNSHPYFTTPTKADDRPANKLSDLPEVETSDSETAVSQGQFGTLSLSGVPGPTLPSAEVSALRDSVRPPITTLNSSHNAREHTPRKSPAFLGRASSWSNSPVSGLPHSISLGSIDELRCNSFVSAQQRVFSMPTIPSRQSSLVGWTCSTPRQFTRTLSLCDVDDLNSLSQLRSDPMFVNIQEGHQVNFVFPPSSSVCSRSVSPAKRSIGSKANSYRSLRQRAPTPLLVRSSGITSGLEESSGTSKIPLFVPSQIIKPATGRLLVPDRQSSRLPPHAALRVGDAQQDEQSNGRQNQSKEALSEDSDWSTTVQFEAPKQEVFQAKSTTGVTPDRSLIDKQEPRPGRGQSLETRRDIPGRVTPSGLDESGSVAGSPEGATNRQYRGLRLFQSWSAYLQRIKQHVWRSSGGTVNSG